MFSARVPEMNGGEPIVIHKTIQFDDECAPSSFVLQSTEIKTELCEDMSQIRGSWNGSIERDHVAPIALLSELIKLQKRVTEIEKLYERIYELEKSVDRLYYAPPHGQGYLQAKNSYETASAQLTSKE